MKFIWYGRKHNEKTKHKIGKANSIAQKGKRNSQYGTCWVTNGKENKKIKKEELKHFLNDNRKWKRGRKINN